MIMSKVRCFLLVAAAFVSVVTMAQTLNLRTGNVIYQIPAAQAGEMVYSGGTQLTILGKIFEISSIDEMFVDNSEVTDYAVRVAYSEASATVKVAGNVMRYLSVTANGADVTISQADDLADEVTYTLSGAASDGSFTMAGKLKATLVLNGINLTSLKQGAITIDNGKRIAIEVADGTANSLADAAKGSQKACFFVKGHAEFTGGGTLNIVGNAKHAFRSNDYTQLKKKFTGVLNITGAASDGLHVQQYYQQNAGTVTINGVGGDGIQVDYRTDDDGNREQDEENTGKLVVNEGTITITTTAGACKGLKAEGNVEIQGGTISITQSGSLTVDGSDISYSTAVKSDEDINITGGTVTVRNTAAGGKGLSADGNINIDETNATTIVDITANGQGGTVETAGGGTEEPAKSYKIYVTLPTSGSGPGGGGPGGGGSSTNPWRNVYLYKSDGTFVQQLTSTVTRSSGYSTLTFYYYDFKSAGDGTTQYYFKGEDYSSSWGGSTTYTIRSSAFTAPTDGSDIYYAITSSYSTSGTVRTYSISDVTTSYGGTSDQSEDSGTAYNAAGIKADGNVTISAGTVTVKNSGAMSKSIKSKATATIAGGTITLSPSGAVQVINSDASYSSGVKAVDFLMSGGSLGITASGAAGKGISVTGMTQVGGAITMQVTGVGQTISGNRYTAKGIKADGNLALNAGSLRITTTQAGAKGIKVNGAYTQGTADGSGPTVYVSTSGARYGASGSSSGGMGGPGGKTTGQGGAAKAIKAMGTVTLYGGETEIHTAADGGEGLESRTSVDIRGGQHYIASYDDGISCSGPIYFNGGVSVVYSRGNDAVDSNSRLTGAITIGNGVVLAYTTAGGAEEGLDCDDNSRIQITGTGIAISGGSSQGGGGGWSWGGSGSTISNAAQGYNLYTSSVSYSAGRYYTLEDVSSGKNLVTYSFEAGFTSSLSLITAKGMVKGGQYRVRWSAAEPTDATTAFHGLYIGSSAVGNSDTISSLTAQ